MSVSKEAKTNYKSDQDIRGIERRTHRPSNKTAGDQQQVTVNVCWAIYDHPFFWQCFWSTWLRTDFRAALHAEAHSETWQEGRYGGLGRFFNIFRDLLWNSGMIVVVLMVRLFSLEDVGFLSCFGGGL